MALLNNIIKGAVIAGAGAAITNTLSNISKVGDLKNAAQNLGGQLDKLKQLPNGDLSQVVNKIPGQVVNELAQGIVGGQVNVPKTKILTGLAEEEVIELDIKERPFTNILQNYASVNYLWTMSVLTPNQVNFPDESYKKGILGDIIFKSASGDPENRIPLSDYGSTSKKSIDANPEGKFDFYIDNVKINGVMGLDIHTKNTNAATMTFDIFEPYSLGLFFQSLMMAAKRNGYENWVIMPILLTLEFKGHYSPDTHFIDYAVAKRHFPIKITNIQMRVTERGSQYEVQAVAWNDEAYSDAISRIKTDMDLQGATVQEMLQTGPYSLQSIYNKTLQELAKKNDIPTPDRILILFPKSTSSARNTGGAGDDSSRPKTATTAGGGGGGDIFKTLGVELGDDGYNYVQKDNVNDVGKASIGFTDRRKIQGIFGEDNVVWDDAAQVLKRGNIKILKDKGTAHFKQSTIIPNILNEIISSSNYGIEALKPGNISKPKGMIQWYKISSKQYLLETTSNIPTTGRNPVVTVYSIIPFEVHHSRFSKVAKKPLGVEYIKKNALKHYDYIYTGKNTDVIDFQIIFQNSFYKATASDGNISNEDELQKNKNATVSTPEVPNAPPPNPSSSKGGNDKTKQLNQQDQTKLKRSLGGIQPQERGTLITKQFMDAIYNGGDMINVNMKILGDPFYLGDSGWGNYTDTGTSNNDINSDGAINYERTEIYISVDFKNPTDINGHVYDFPGPKAVQAISGVYKVNLVESTFHRGLFSQTLQMNRMPNQDIDGAEEPTILLEQKDPDSPREIQQTGFSDVL